MTSQTQTIAYVDGAQMLYRAEFGFPTRILNRRGHDITGTFGFLALTRQALHRSLLRPTHAIVVFDADAPASRAQLDPRYRAARRREQDARPSNPFRHLAWIRRALDIWEITHLEHEGTEADDVIATLVERGRCAGHGAVVVSRDKDFHQLVEDDVRQWDSARGLQRGWITPASIAARYGVHPAQWCDYVALVGDRADEMPGVRGIGPVTARRLLGDGRLLEDIGSGLPAADLLEALHQRDLHRLDRHVPLPRLTPTRLPADGLPSAAVVLEKAGLWDAPSP